MVYTAIPNHMTFDRYKREFDSKSFKTDKEKYILFFIHFLIMITNTWAKKVCAYNMYKSASLFPMEQYNSESALNDRGER